MFSLSPLPVPRLPPHPPRPPKDRTWIDRKPSVFAYLGHGRKVYCMALRHEEELRLDPRGGKLIMLHGNNCPPDVHHIHRRFCGATERLSLSGWVNLVLRRRMEAQHERAMRTGPQFRYRAPRATRLSNGAGGGQEREPTSQVARSSLDSSASFQTTAQFPAARTHGRRWRAQDSP